MATQDVRFVVAVRTRSKREVAWYPLVAQSPCFFASCKTKPEGFIGFPIRWGKRQADPGTENEWWQIPFFVPARYLPVRHR